MSFKSITEKDQGHKTKPDQYKHIPDSEFADPVNFKYPIDAEHVQAAWAYINKDENRVKGGYTPAEWAIMKQRVRAAMKKYGHEVAPEPRASMMDPANYSYMLQQQRGF